MKIVHALTSTRKNNNMGKISEQRRCNKCGNKSYTTYEGGLKFFTYSCKCGHVFTKLVITGNVKLAQMIADDPKTFGNLTVSDLIQILEEQAFKTEKYFGSYLQARELAHFKEELSKLPLSCQLILDVCRRIQNEKVMVERKELVEVFSTEQNLKPEVVEKYIEKLLRIGGLFVPREGFLMCTYSFDDKTNKD